MCAHTFWPVSVAPKAVALLRTGIAPQDRIEFSRGGLVVIDAVQAEAEYLHGDAAVTWWIGGCS
jgi:hypothetical protein